MRILNKQISRRAVLQGAGVAALAALTAGCGKQQSPAAASEPQEIQETQKPDKMPSEQYRAMWLSYLDWHLVGFSSQSAFEKSFETVLENCQSLGLNTLIAQVRPFGDALYPSTLFPWSHLCTGIRGKDPGFDPLDCMVRLCHERAISLEAWINPYRLRANAKMPAEFAENDLPNTHPEWCVTVGEGVYLNPAEPSAADYVVQGITELLDHYAVDGIHFDDYFYPTTEAEIDAAQYAAASSTLPLEEWRRQQVTNLVRNARDAVKAKDPTLRFGISPQGNPDNNYNQQYSDVDKWVNDPDGPLVDYICPQVYWGYGYQLKSGSTRFAYENITAEWVKMPRSEACDLYFGLGAYRIGDGDGGANPDSKTQWESGHQLADMISDLTKLGADGYGLFRYEFLFASNYPELAAAECSAVAEKNKELAAQGQ